LGAEHGQRGVSLLLRPLSTLPCLATDLPMRRASRTRLASRWG